MTSWRRANARTWQGFPGEKPAARSQVPVIVMLGTLCGRVRRASFALVRAVRATQGIVRTLAAALRASMRCGFEGRAIGEAPA
jgi:hypothetical protein